MKLRDLLNEAENLGKRPLELKYPKIQHLADALGDEGGEQVVKDAFSSAVEITAKMDGQQFAVYLDENNDPTFYTKSMKLDPAEFDLKDMYYKTKRAEGSDYKDYGRVILHFMNLKKQGKLDKLPPNSLISGEFYGSKKPNVIMYEREPKGNFILFGLKTGEEWADYDTLVKTANLLDVEVVPVLFSGEIKNKKSFLAGLSKTLRANKQFMQSIKDYFEKKGNEKIDTTDDLQKILALFLNLSDPLLGSEHLEGVVIKNYDLKTAKGKNKFFKLVRSEFAEERNSNWEDVNKIGRQMRNLSNQLRWGKITEKQYQAQIKELNLFTYLIRATAFDALFGIENRVAKAVAGLKEKNQEINPSNVIAWVREDMKEENMPNKVYSIYKKNEKGFDALYQGKAIDDVYGEFFRTAMMLLKQNYQNVIDNVKG